MFNRDKENQHGMARGSLNCFAFFPRPQIAPFTDVAEGHRLLRRLRHFHCWTGGWALLDFHPSHFELIATEW